VKGRTTASAGGVWPWSELWFEGVEWGESRCDCRWEIFFILIPLLYLQAKEKTEGEEEKTGGGGWCVLTG